MPCGFYTGYYRRQQPPWWAFSEKSACSRSTRIRQPLCGPLLWPSFCWAWVFCQGSIDQIPALLADRKTFGFIVLSGLAGALSWLFYFLALQYGKVAQVAPIDKLSVVLATILAVLFLGEKISFLNGVGVALIAAGAILVALS